MRVSPLCVARAHISSRADARLHTLHVTAACSHAAAPARASATVLVHGLMLPRG